MKYYIITYGCQMNKSDSERIAAVLERVGWKTCKNEKQADLIVVDACSVRQSAIDRIFGKSRGWQKKRKTGKLKTVLTGCVLKEDRKKFADKFDLVLDIKNIKKLPRLLKSPTVCLARPLSLEYLKLKPVRQGKISAFVPIMTGCNNFCTYCVVPYTRGREVSRSVEEILSEAKRLIKRDCKDITLVGQNVNSYQGKAFNFPKLLKLVNDIPGNFKLRFITSHPKDMSDELIKIMAKCEKVVKEIHLPIQAGDNNILKKMNRGYTTGHYKKLIKKIRKAMPNIVITTDIIVGFPGETKKQFKKTVELCREIKFDKAYLARYSLRAGTAAAKLKDDVPFAEKKRRWWKLEKLINEK